MICPFIKTSFILIAPPFIETFDDDSFSRPWKTENGYYQWLDNRGFLKMFVSPF